MNIIAIAGLKNSGKDTVAFMLRYLLSTPKILHYWWLFQLLKYGYLPKWNIVSFAGALKETLSAMIGVDYEKFNDRQFKECCFIHLPSLTITLTPPKDKILNDKKFNRYIQSKNFSFIEEYYLSMRQLLQMYGTEIIRDLFGDKFWVLRTFAEPGNLIISDLRFKTEYESVKDKSGAVIYIERNLEPGLHPSEQEVIDLLNNNKYDYIINNSGSLKDLFYKTKNYLKWQKIQ